MAISKKIDTAMTQGSFIRRMFEEGIRMRKEVGADRVFDFSLGNPILEPPAAFREALKRAVNDPVPGMHRYMPNAGYPESRAKVAAHLARELGLPVTGADVMMTTGAGAGLNVALKALLDPGDEVVVIAPYFPEYAFYIDNHGGVMHIAESAADFDLDLGALDAAIGTRTRVLILNSPNNPTGRMYSAERLKQLGELLAAKERTQGRPITILSDEPYRKIVFHGLTPPSIFEAHPNVVLINSHSKDLGLAGERIGYAAISPHERLGSLAAALPAGQPGDRTAHHQPVQPGLHRHALHGPPGRQGDGQRDGRTAGARHPAGLAVKR
jgi:aspartate aminotransferase